MVEISASLLSMNDQNYVKTLYNLETAKIDYFHIDVMDGKFVEKNTKNIMKEYALTISHISNLGLDVHLMVEDVEHFIDEYLVMEPEIITFHIESMKNDEQRTQNIIRQIKQSGSKVGIAISPDTSLEEIKKYLKYIHMILVMTVVPGKGGQELIPQTLEKVKNLKKYIAENNIDIDIEVDGGINDKTSKDAIIAGANILVVGNYLISNDNKYDAVKKIKE